MSVLVTGGIGWVPSHVVRALAEDDDVVVLDLMEPDALFHELIEPVAARVTVVHGDTTDLAFLEEIVRERSITRIVHAAAITPRREREMAEPERIIAVNLGALVNVLHIARTHPAITRTLFISSGSALGDVVGVDIVDEETPSAAMGLYGVLKHTGERIVRRYADLFDIDAFSVRLANVYGPMERFTPGYSGATEMREMLRIHFAGSPILINSLEGPWLDWTYVADIADGVRTLMAAQSHQHDLYTITSGRNYSIGDLLAEFQRNLPDLVYREVPADEANYIVSGDPAGAVPSPARMRDEFGWTTQTAFPDGMRQYLNWISAHGTF